MTAAHKARRAASTVAHAIDRHGRSHTLFVTIAFCLFWAPVILFAALADEVLERQPIGPDNVILTWVFAHHTPLLDNVFLFATSLGQPLSVVGIGVALLGFLILTKRYRAAAAVAAGAGGAALANVLLKLMFTRIRPTEVPSLLTESGYSFPSGHAMVTAGFVFTLMILLWRTRYRIPALVVGSFLIAVVGISRVYVGVHYPSDVLAGWSVGVVWAVIACSLLLDFPFTLHRYISRLLKKIA